VSAAGLTTAFTHLKPTMTEARYNYMTGWNQPAEQSEPLPSSRCLKTGFASLFLGAVNATWPHRDHILVNVGRGGVNLYFWADECIGSLLPSRVDVLILESYNIDDNEREMQHAILPLIAQVAVNSPDLAVLLLSVPQTVPPRYQDAGLFPFSPDSCADGYGGFGKRCTQAMHPERPGKTDYACTAGMIANLSESLRLTSPMDEAFSAHAQLHGWTVLSLRRALATALDDGAHLRVGWSECEWINAFYSDYIHWTTWLAKRLLADAILTHTLLAAQALPSDLALHAAAPSQGPKTCFMTRFCFDARDLSMHPIHHGHTGWHYSATEFVHNHVVNKPGWIAEAPGDSTGLFVRTLLPGVQEARDVFVALQFTGSACRCSARCSLR
jgi:hypothetical protein